MITVKLFLQWSDVDQLIEDTYDKMKADGVEIDYIVAIGGGGFIPARMMRSYLHVPIFAVGMKAYDDHDELNTVTTTQWLDEDQIARLKGKNVLIVDEIDDTGTTLAACWEMIAKYKCKNIYSFVLHNKSTKDKVNKYYGIFWNEDEGNYIHNYYVGKCISDIWVVYPWESTNHTKHRTLPTLGMFDDKGEQLY